MEANTSPRIGLRKKVANCASFSGSSMLKRSLDPRPMISSLMSGLPMRCTWRQAPEVSRVGSGERRTVTPGAKCCRRCRAGPAGSIGGVLLPSWVSSSIGTSMAIVLTLKPATSSAAKLVLSSASWAGARTPPPRPAEVQGVEGRAKVDVEGVVGRAGEHLDALAQVVDPLFEEAAGE